MRAPQDAPGGRFVATAMFFDDSDCVEYVKEDTFYVYDRVDEFLTLIFDESKINLIGFKLKGFKHLLETRLTPILRLNDNQFVEVVQIIEEVCKEIGDDLFTSDERKRAYKAARKLAVNDNVKLYGTELKIAA